MVWTICNTISGVTIGVYTGRDEVDALETYARDAGYKSYAAACKVASVAPGEIIAVRACDGCATGGAVDSEDFGAAEHFLGNDALCAECYARATAALDVAAYIAGVVDAKTCAARVSELLNEEDGADVDNALDYARALVKKLQALVNLEGQLPGDRS